MKILSQKRPREAHDVGFDVTLQATPPSHVILPWPGQHDGARSANHLPRESTTLAELDSLFCGPQWMPRFGSVTL